MHPTTIKGFETLEDAAKEVGKLRYDALVVFLHHLAYDFEAQQQKDMDSGKVQLAEAARFLILELLYSRDAAEALYNLSKDHMKEELAINPELKYPDL